MTTFSNLIKNKIVSPELTNLVSQADATQKSKTRDILESRLVQLFQLKALLVIKQSADETHEKSLKLSEDLLKTWFSVKDWPDFCKQTKKVDPELCDNVVQAWRRLEFVILGST